MKLLIWTCLFMNLVLIFVCSCLLRLWVDLGNKCTLLKSFIYFLLFFFNNFLYFILHPKIISLQEGRMAWNQVPFTLFDDRFKCTLYIYFMFGKLMLFHQLLLRLFSFIIQIFPNWLDIISVCIIYSLDLLILMSRRSAKFLLLISLGRMHYLMIGLKVLLLIKIHFLYILFNFMFVSLLLFFFNQNI